jgi:hypothetical protein
MPKTVTHKVIHKKSTLNQTFSALIQLLIFSLLIKKVYYAQRKRITVSARRWFLLPV